MAAVDVDHILLILVIYSSLFTEDGDLSHKRGYAMKPPTARRLNATGLSSVHLSVCLTGGFRGGGTGVRPPPLNLLHVK